MKKSTKLWSTVLFLGIIGYGFFKNQVKRVYALPVRKITGWITGDEYLLDNAFNQFSISEEIKMHLSGWVIYYPTYLALHLLFIWFLFYEQPKTRKWLMMALTLLTALLVMLAVVGKALEAEVLYTIAYRLFQNLFGLPFILLSIEGGRILLKDIDNKLPRNGS